MTVLAKVARALYDHDRTLDEHDDATPKWEDVKSDYEDHARAALLAMRDEMKEMRVHTDGYKWKRGNGPFLVWDEVEDTLAQPSTPTDVTPA